MGNRRQLNKILDLLEEAKTKNGKIAVLGDFDTDGISGATIFYQGLKNLGFKSAFLDLLPEGFSLRKASEWKSKNVFLGILIDTGSKKYEEVKLAKRNGIKIAIIDHHRADKYPDTPAYYSFKKAACQLSYEVIKKLYSKEKKKGFLRYTSLVTIGTLADRVPITKANRKIVEEGLNRINRGENKGIKTFLDRLKIKRISLRNQEAILNYLKFPKGKNEDNIFYKLFTSNDKRELVKISREIIKNYNDFKKVIDKFIKKISPSNVIFIENEITPFTPGLSGTLSEFALEKFKKPTFVYRINGDFIRLSARSPQKGPNLLKLFKKCSKWFQTYGGHPHAAGFKAKTKDLEEIKKCVLKSSQ